MVVPIETAQAVIMSLNKNMKVSLIEINDIRNDLTTKPNGELYTRNTFSTKYSNEQLFGIVNDYAINHPLILPSNFLSGINIFELRTSRL